LQSDPARGICVSQAKFFPDLIRNYDFLKCRTRIADSRERCDQFLSSLPVADWHGLTRTIDFFHFNQQRMQKNATGGNLFGIYGNGGKVQKKFLRRSPHTKYVQSGGKNVPHKEAILDVSRRG
jgi:hypothetical protein